MTKFLKWLDGKKRVIGCAILSVVTVLGLLGVDLPNVNEESITKNLDSLVYALTAIAGVVMAVAGVIHKVVKLFAAKKKAA